MQKARGTARPGGLRVLIVEDEYFIAEDIARAAAALGGEVVGPAPDIAMGLELLDSGTEIDVAVLDINLRGHEVFELADKLMSRDIPFVFATGYDAGAIPERFRLTPLWEKPFDAAELAAALTMIDAARQTVAP